MVLEQLVPQIKARDEKDTLLEGIAREIKDMLGRGMVKKDFVKDVVLNHILSYLMVRNYAKNRVWNGRRV